MLLLGGLLLVLLLLVLLVGLLQLLQLLGSLGHGMLHVAHLRGLGGRLRDGGLEALQPRQTGRGQKTLLQEVL